MNTETQKVDEYRAERAGDAWMCIRGNDWQSAPLYDTQDEAQDAADEMNGRYYTDGRPANVTARLEVSHG